MTARILTRWLLAGSLLLASAASATDAGRDIAYRDLAKMPFALKKVDPSKVYEIIFQAKPAQGQATLPADLTLEIRLDKGSTPIALGPTGRFELPLRQDWIDADAQLRINQPKDRVVIAMNVNPRVPAGTEMSYATLTESAGVMQRGIKEMAGMMSFMAPKVRTIRLGFAAGTPGKITLTLPDGERKQWPIDANGHAELPWNESWRDAHVALSAPLTSIAPVLK